MKKPQFKPHFRIEIIKPKNVYLLSEQTSHVLTGQLYCQLAPFLDGNHTLEDISRKLTGKVNIFQIYTALNSLAAKGYITESVETLNPEIAAFWSLLSVAPQDAIDSLQQTQVYIISIGNISTPLFITAINSIGIENYELGIENWQSESGNKKKVLVVLTDDYLQPELAKINQISQKEQLPWMLVKPVGSTLWLGPLFYPAKTGCWQCLAHRLRGNRDVETSILQQKFNSPLTSAPFGGQISEIGCLPTSRAILPTTLQIAFNLAATELAKWIVKNSQEIYHNISTLESKILTLDTTSLYQETHILSQRTQCPICGKVTHNQTPQPVILTSRKKQFTSDGGHRTFSPDRTVQRYQHLVSPITGIVSFLTRTSDPDSSLVHTYLAVHNFGISPDNLDHLRERLYQQSAGKGKTEIQAKASGLCEALERYSGIFQGDETRLSSTLSKLGNKAIDPRKCLHFSDRQYQNREELNHQNTLGLGFIPQPFDETKAIEWTAVWSLTEQIHKYLPTALCYYDCPLPDDHRFCITDSNGNAAGNTLEEAIFQGFFELVERDSVSIWWYNRLSRPAVDLASFDEPYLLDLQALYRRKNRDFWVLDITTDLQIPTFAAVSCCTEGEHQKIIPGFGAHLDPKIAILRAVTEVNQGSTGVDVDDIDFSKLKGVNKEWYENATLVSHPYLAPNPSLPVKAYEDYQKLSSDDITQDVMKCVEIVKNLGMETLVLDQTRPDIGLNVVKVIVPELRHFWPRFGAGRLYDVPIKMGWLSAALSEEEMNPTPILW